MRMSESSPRLDAIITPPRSRFWDMLKEQRFKASRNSTRAINAEQLPLLPSRAIDVELLPLLPSPTIGATTWQVIRPSFFASH